MVHAPLYAKRGPMSEPRFTSHVRVTREHPPLRTAELLETGETVTFGTPGYQGDFYGFGEGELRERGGTFDYLLASVAACLTGTLGRALTARGIPSDGDRLTSRAEAEVVVEDGGTFDYLLASVAACLTGTLGRALTVRGMATGSPHGPRPRWSWRTA